jgi:hypothetical protein
MKSSLIAFAFGAVALGLAADAGVAQDKKAEKPEVRHVKFTPADPTLAFMIGGKGKVTVLMDAESVEKQFAKADAKMLADAVDFTKESLALVSWTTSGPPDGVLQHEFKGEGKERKLTFYVQGPPGAKIRGQRARIAFDFFVVPRDVAVSLEPKERR